MTTFNPTSNPIKKRSKGKRILRRMLWFFGIFLFVVMASAFYVTQPLLSSRKAYTSPGADSVMLRDHVEALATTVEPRNPYTPKGLEEAADYIVDEIKELGITTQDQPYTIKGNQTVRNILWHLGPEDGPRLVVGAHYDVCGEQAGADDNASGVAGLIELTRLLQAKEADLPCRIDFVAYTLEEPPFFRTKYMGSAVHAQSIMDDSIDVKAMICLEMIGYFDTKKGSQSYPIGALKLFYPNTGDFIAVVGKLGEGGLVRRVKREMRNGSNLPVRSINAPASIPGIDFSDHQNYWNNDIPAVMITNTSFYRNPHYHEKTDTPEKLDYGRMAEVVNGVYWAVMNFKL